MKVPEKGVGRGVRLLLGWGEDGTQARDAGLGRAVTCKRVGPGGPLKRSFGLSLEWDLLFCMLTQLPRDMLQLPWGPV